MRLISAAREQEIVRTLAKQAALVEQANETRAKAQAVIESQAATIKQQALTIAHQAVRIAQLEVQVEAYALATAKRIYGRA